MMIVSENLDKIRGELMGNYANRIKNEYRRGQVMGKPMGKPKKMSRSTALMILANGHTIWSVECAKKVCENVGVPWKEGLARPHYTTQDYYTYISPGWSQKYNLYMDVEGEITVADIDLRKHVMNELGVEPDRRCNGRGSQAEADTVVISAELDRREQISRERISREQIGGKKKESWKRN